ncbi:MAG: hypothetical protein IBX64_03845 [Actinobacteria bacterium]|nr:hypothetical protein [Actinomycetota bacterium]
MGSLTRRFKKRKSRKAKARLTSLITIATSVAFLHAASAFYLREVYNIKTLAPSWGIAKGDIIFSVGDLMILKNDVALKILVDTTLLTTEQIRLAAILMLVLAMVYNIGKSWFDRVSLFLFVVGLWGVLYYAFLFALLRWPDSLLSKDVITLFPLPVIVPVYIPLLFSLLVLVGSTFLVFKKN